MALVLTRQHAMSICLSAGRPAERPTPSKRGFEGRLIFIRWEWADCSPYKVDVPSSPRALPQTAWHVRVPCLYVPFSSLVPTHIGLGTFCRYPPGASIPVRIPAQSALNVLLPTRLRPGSRARWIPLPKGGCMQVASGCRSAGSNRPPLLPPSATSSCPDVSCR